MILKRLAATLILAFSLVALPSCLASTISGFVVSAVKDAAVKTIDESKRAIKDAVAESRREAADNIRRETAQAAKDNKLNPMEIALYSALAALVGGGGAGYVGAKNGKKKTT